jgi:cob(I)alamin adenosyltransferase
VVRCVENDEKSVDGVVLRYVNRLSDYFFILSRFIAKNLEIIVFVWEK